MKTRSNKSLLFLPIVLGLILVNPASAAEAAEPQEGGAQIEEIESTGEGGSQDLAKAAQNPVGDLISFPIQNNMRLDYGPNERVFNTMNIQPVYPVKLNDNWNLITRTILPVVSAPIPGNDRTNGIGDLNFTGFFSPRAPGKVIWGLGPVLAFPTASDDLLGTDRYSAGISAVVLTMPGSWVVGGLVSQMWDYAGDKDGRKVDSFLFQYFINYNFPNGWYFTSAPIITADWTAKGSETWTVPFGGGFGKIVRWGKLPLNINSQIFYNVKKPTGGADWEWRFQIQAMFPK